MCSSDLLNLLKQLPYQDYPLSIMPNSGYLTSLHGRNAFSVDNPEYFAEKVADIYALGVKVLGACCGSTPLYTQYIAKKLSQAPTTAQAAQLTTHTPVAVATPTMPDEFIAVELDAPATNNIEKLLYSAKAVKEAGVDFVTIPDSPLARTRANSLMISSLLKRTEIGRAPV